MKNQDDAQFCAAGGELSDEQLGLVAGGAPACVATSDGGKWCCIMTADQPTCWKVDPPRPPDTIWTRQVPLAGKMLWR